MYSYPTQETHIYSPLSHSQSSRSHTLPVQTRAFYSGEACPVVHCSALPQGHALIPPSLTPNQSLVSSPYRELRYSTTPPTSCSCRDCSRLREDVALHSLRDRELEALPWSREVEFGIRREGPMHWRDGRVASHWEGVHEAEYWRRKLAVSPVTSSYGHCHAVPKQDQPVYVSDAQPEHITPLSPYPSTQSSGYHSPHPPCPCSPQPFRESPGYHPGSCYTSTSPQPPLCSSERSSASEFPSFNINAERQGMTTLTDYNEESSNRDLTASDPDGYITPSFPIASYSYPLLTVPHVPYTGYTEITIPASLPQPPLPEKQRSSPLHNVSDCTGTSSIKSAGKPSTSSAQFHVSFSTTTNELPPASKCKVTPSSGVEEPENRLSSKFVQDSSKYWYKPGISRDQAIAVLKDKEPGCFLIRDSNSFQGAYGMALKVSTPPAHASNHGETGNPQEQLVRHFLIESSPKGVKIKGCQNETYFGSLSALVYQHSITPVSLPCVLRIPYGVCNNACNVLYLNSVETESLTGPQAISKATKCTLTQDPRPSPTVVHFKVSTQGITLTDNQRRLFFRRHYPIHSVTFSSVDPLDQRMFGFVARRSGGLGNVCHLFAELDPEQPATAIVNFINKVMLGPQQLRK
uniref:SH2 domain-containing protein n=1 Tax=Sinocyclocheilus anshuiensis TaxID=1608454 RepID=A0A671RZW5_9TELE